METGDWAQAVLGLLSLIATVLVAWMVYRLQRKDNERSEESMNRRADSRDAADAERERQALRRERHRDDYKRANETLNAISKARGEVLAAPRPLTRSELQAFSLGDTAEVLLGIAERIPVFKIAFLRVYLGATRLSDAAFPSESDLERVWTASYNQTSEAYRFISDACTNAIAQVHRAGELEAAITSARDMIAAEWGPQAP